MNGYLQRIALTALRPGDSIQPVLGSVFAPAEAPGIPEMPSLETTRAVVARARRESGERTDLTSSFGSPRTPDGVDLAPEPDSTELESTTLAPRPLSTSRRAPGLRGPKQKQKKDIEPLLPAESSKLLPEGAPKSEGEPTVSPAPKPRFQTREPAPANPVVTGQAPRERAMEPLQAKPTTGTASIQTGTSIRPLVDIPGAEYGPQTGTGSSIKRVIGVLRGESAPGKAIPDEETSREPAVSSPRTERMPETGVASQHVRMPPATPSIPFRSGSEAKEGIGPIRRSLRSEPDEIQIHIGRIEVVAVQPAPAQPVSQKAQRATPSLDEYLQRRDRRSG